LAIGWPLDCAIITTRAAVFQKVGFRKKTVKSEHARYVEATQDAIFDRARGQELIHPRDLDAMTCHESP
jgi:hypothetical protein